MANQYLLHILFMELIFSITFPIKLGNKVILLQLNHFPGFLVAQYLTSRVNPIHYQNT